MPLTEPTTSPLGATMLSLHIDGIVAQVVTALRAKGVHVLLLKGASVARWLHDDGAVRPYRDVDLLVAPTALVQAGVVLERLGYSRRHPDSSLGRDSSRADDAGHADEWDQPGWPTIDLHHTLQGALAPPQKCWEILSSRTAPLVVGGTEVEVLETSALACNLALHAADSGGSHRDGATGPKRKKALDDLARAINRLEVTGWHEALRTAEALEAVAAFGVGLRLNQRGRELADELAVPESLTVELVLRASSESVLALPFDRLVTAAGLQAKVRVVVQELVPSASFLRRWWPPAARGRLWLGVGYLYRWAWVLTHSPRGLRTWQRARRVVATGESPHSVERETPA